MEPSEILANPMTVMAVKEAFSYMFKKNNDKKKESTDSEEIILEKLKKQTKNYIERKYTEFSYIKPLALGGERILLKDLYYPLTITTEDRYVDNDKAFKINKFDFKMFDNSFKVLIQDSAGMGKSTLIKYLFLSYLESEEAVKSGFIPLFIEVRNLEEGDTIKSLLKKTFFTSNNVKDSNIIDNLLKQKIIFFLDGFDEISEMHKENAILEINNLTATYPENLYVLSSRPEALLSNITNYIKYSIKPLNVKEAKELLKKYMVNKKDFIELSNQIDKHKNLLSDFLRTPLLASLLYRAFSYKKEIPETKLDYYTQVFDALYQDHDITSKCGYVRKIELPKIGFQKLLEEFSMTNIKTFKIQFTKSEMIEKLEIIKKKTDLSYNTLKILENFIKEVPLFRKEGNNYFWSHKSMQEFFIALKISKLGNQKEELIKRLITSEKNMKYINIIEFLYDLEGTLFKKIITETTINQIHNIQKNCLDESFEISSFFFTHPSVLVYRFKKDASDLKDENEDSLENPEEKMDRIDKIIKKRFDLSEIENMRYATLAMRSEGDVYTKHSVNPLINILNILKIRKINLFKKRSRNTGDFDKIEKEKFYYCNSKNPGEISLIKEFFHLHSGSHHNIIDYKKLIEFRKGVVKQEKYSDDLLDDVLDNL